MARSSTQTPPPNTYRLRVQARQALPKKFQWEIVQYGTNSAVTIIRSSAPEFYATMEAAYQAGTPILHQYHQRGG